MKLPHDDDRLLIAAYYRSRGLSEEQIADKLNVSQTTISNDLKTAIERRILKSRNLPEFYLDETQIPAGKMQKILEKVGEPHRTLATKLAKKDVRLFVVPSAGSGTVHDSYNRRLEQFGIGAAIHIAELLPKVRTMGVAWGRTTGAVVAGLRVHYSSGSLRPDGPIQFVPVMGEPVDYPFQRISSSSLVGELHEIVNQQASGALSLGPIPARISRSLSKFREGESVMRAFLSSSTAYSRIFGGGGGRDLALVEQLDCILTSTGVVFSKEKNEMWLEDTLKSEDMDVQQLRALTIGDICGVFIPESRYEKEITNINKRWTGIQLSHLEKCAKGARQDRIGVIVVAIGVAKMEIIHECVQRKLINVLVVDDDLAGALAKRVE